MAEAAALRAEVIRRYIRRLQDLGSPLVAEEAIKQQTVAGAESILGSVFPGAMDDMADTNVSPVAIGKARALQEIHPSFSLAASSVLFEIGVAVMREQVHIHVDADEAFMLASRLQKAIMDRIVPASSQYVDVLVDKVDKSNQHERLSVSRHLHDNVAHGIAAAIQRLQLSRRTEGSHPLESDELCQALSVLQETLRTVRDVATTLRNVVGERDLDAALAELLEDSSGYSGNIELVTSGHVGLLASHIKEELFIILREGIRNALQHAVGMETLRVGVEAGPVEVLAYVEDDGAGFSAQPTVYSHIGLQSMRERTELLGGSWSLRAVEDEGCRVTVRIPAVDGRPVVFV